MLLSLSLLACRPEGTTKYAVDADEDGLGPDEDCDDSDAAVGTATTWYTDGDADGYGTDAEVTACEAPTGAVSASGDCDDTDASVHPGAVEECDEADDDCDGVIDNGVALTTFYADGDGDGHGGEASVDACAPPDGYVADPGDCDDADPDWHPGAAETDCTDPNDYNCDGSVGWADDDADGYPACQDCDDADAAANVPLTWYADLDADTFGDAANTTSACAAPTGFVADASDCDDLVAAVNPAAAEVCNGLDDNCDSLVDDDATDRVDWYLDSDADGYGDAATTVARCEQPEGYAATGDDCDDADAAYNPGASEADCTDPNDYNCDGTTGYADADADTWAACEECDDANANNFPGATEYCDTIDNDCDGDVDEDAADDTWWFEDADGDGYGYGGMWVWACDRPSGYVANDDDCDDADADVNPGHVETCNGVDDDCDGDTDEASEAVDAGTWYRDDDGDGYGDPDVSARACEAPPGWLADASDCDDADADIHPGGTEVCNGADDDCDGAADGTDAWWDTDFPSRIALTLTAASTTVAGPPVAAELDFGEDFDPDTMRVVIQDCSLGQPELPSQFLDAWVGLFEKQASDDPEGDGAGTVVFLYDTDGDYSSLESLSGGATVYAAVYFGGSASSPGYAGDLAATASTLENDLTVNTFDDTAGGLLASMIHDGSPNLQNQVDSCCGNSIYSASWGIDPQDGSGTLSVLEDGPIFAALTATGSRADSQSSYDYTYLYWMFAGRPELWNKVHQVTTTASTLSHPTDFTYGIRPWEALRDEISSGASFTTDPAMGWADVNNGTWGVTVGYAQAPAHVVTLSNYDPYVIVVGNDYAASGSGTPGTMPVGTAYFDHILQVIYPYAGSFTTTVQDDFAGLLEGVTVSAGSVEAR